MRRWRWRGGWAAQDLRLWDTGASSPYSAWTRGALNKSDPPWSSAGERSPGCVAAGAGALPPSGGDCDYLDPHQCLLHFLQVKPVQSQASPTQGPSLWSALPWVGAKGSEMNLSSHCLPGRPWASLPAPQSVRRQQTQPAPGTPASLQTSQSPQGLYSPKRRVRDKPHPAPRPLHTQSRGYSSPTSAHISSHLPKRPALNTCISHPVPWPPPPAH